MMQQVFCKELLMFLREHLNGMYRLDIYFLCKTIAEIPIFIAIPVLFSAIVYYMIGLNPEIQRFFIAIAIVTLVVNVATLFAAGSSQTYQYSRSRAGEVAVGKETSRRTSSRPPSKETSRRTSSRPHSNYL